MSRLHLGGGTPTILPPRLTTRLLADVFETFELTKGGEFSVEIDPTDVDEDRLDVLVRFGMNRASIGVQDFDPKVQTSIGRPQSFAQTKWLCDALRTRGVTQLNMDVLFGLPHQNWTELQSTLRQVTSLRPNRMAMFGYAHVPWMSKRQAMIPEDALPDPHMRLEHFDSATALLSNEGYQQIGIDHFALPRDGLAKAAQSGALKRNFQGYTDDTSDVLIGLGASSISQFPQGLAQNGSVFRIPQTARSFTRIIVHGADQFTPQDKTHSIAI